jgi:uncharacterized protein
MQVNLHEATGNQFNSYADHQVSINQVEYTDNLIVGPTSVEKTSWRSINELNLTNLEPLLAHNPDLIIFGTGGKIQYPSSEILRHLQRKQIGFEVMTIAALCRTFNYLSAEGRKVVALILF